MDRLTIAILIGLAILGVLAFWVVPPVSQPLWYHEFDDKRALFGIPNFWNVISNVAFVIVGLWGIHYLASPQSLKSVARGDRWMYVVFFAAVALTGVASAYYHLAPDNQRLVWDRLPIAIMLMALFAIIMTEYLSRSVGVWSFFPLVLTGAGTVLYWQLTENWGRGDLRPYLLAQIYSVLAILAIIWRCPPRYTRTGNLYAALAWYAAAKLYEFLDQQIYSMGQVVSGHTLKHLGAAVSCYLILSWLQHRRPPDHSTAPSLHGLKTR